MLSKRHNSGQEKNLNRGTGFSSVLQDRAVNTPVESHKVWLLCKVTAEAILSLWRVDYSELCSRFLSQYAWIKEIFCKIIDTKPLQETNLSFLTLLFMLFQDTIKIYPCILLHRLTSQHIEFLYPSVALSSPSIYSYSRIPYAPATLIPHAHSHMFPIKTAKWSVLMTLDNVIRSTDSLPSFHASLCVRAWPFPTPLLDHLFTPGLYISHS